MLKQFILFISTIIVFSSCQKEQEILIHCAGGLKKPISKIAKEFEEKYNVKTVINYDGSNRLLSSIKLTKKGDIYIAGDFDYIKMAKADGITIKEDKIITFTPVIIVQKNNPLNIKKLSDLTNEGMSIAQGDSKASAIGRLMKQIPAFQKLDEKKWKRNLKTKTATVNELALFVSMGTLDGAIVWDAIANLFTDKVEVIKIPKEENLSVPTGICVLNFSKNRKQALNFLDFATSSRAKEIFNEMGYNTDEK